VTSAHGATIQPRLRHFRFGTVHQLQQRVTAARIHCCHLLRGIGCRPTSVRTLQETVGKRRETCVCVCVCVCVCYPESRHGRQVADRRTGRDPQTRSKPACLLACSHRRDFTASGLCCGNDEKYIQTAAEICARTVLIS
jgi:hypothetical protein